MYSVYVEYLDGTNETFYATGTWSEGAGGRVLYWENDKGDMVTIPVSIIKKTIERESN